MHILTKVLSHTLSSDSGLGRACLAGLFVVSCLLPQAALASGSHSQVAELTQQLESLLKDTSEGNEVALSAIQRVVLSRSESLKRLMRESPADVAQFQLPAALRDRLPMSFSESVEAPFSQSGELEVVFRDEESGKAQLHYYLKTSHQRLEILLTDPRPGLRTGMQVHALGTSLDNLLAISSGADLEVLAYGGTADGSASGSSGLTGTMGAQQVAVLMVNFTSQPEVPWTAQQVEDAVFFRANDFIRENAYGQTWLEGDVFGWFTLNVDPAGCPSSDIAVAGKQAASEAGIDLSTYTRIVFAFPDIGCSYSGEATVGGSPSYAWFDGTITNAGVVSHELGHNLGLYHAHSLDCGADVLNSSCTVFEYGDVLDRMGTATAGHYNAYQKSRLGWVGEFSSAELLSPTVSGTYTIESLSSQNAGAKALRFPRSVDPATGNTEWFYVEYRDGTGADGFLAGSRYEPTVSGGVVVHVGEDADPNSSGLLDMTPNSQKYDMDDFALAFGSSFTDSVSGITISVSQSAAGQALVQLDLGDGDSNVCQSATPSLQVLSASTSAAVTAGTAVDYRFAVTNEDGAACPGANISLVAEALADWDAMFAEPVLMLAPGERQEVILTVVSAASSTAGYYDINVKAQHESGTLSGSQVTYVIEAPSQQSDVQAPTQPLSLAVNVGRRKADLSWQPSSDNVAVAGYRVWRNGMLIADTGTNSYSDFDYQKGMDYQYQVEAYDAAGNLSVPSEIVSTADTSTTTSGGGSKGGGKGKK